MKLLILLLSIPLATPGRASPPSELIKKAAFDQRIGAELPDDAAFVEDTGAAVTVRALARRRPSILVPVYLSCPTLCPLVLEGLVKSLRLLPQTVGRDFDVVVYSFDPRDGPKAAGERRRALVSMYRRAGSEAGFHVLTGPAASIARLNAAVGLRTVPQNGQFAHAPGVVVLDGAGRPSRYLFGLDYSARDLQLALTEASEGKLGRLTDQALLLCFQYDEAAGRYTVSVLKALRVLAGCTVVGLLLGAALLARSGGARA